MHSATKIGKLLLDISLRPVNWQIGKIYTQCFSLVPRAQPFNEPHERFRLCSRGVHREHFPFGRFTAPKMLVRFSYIPCGVLSVRHFEIAKP